MDIWNSLKITCRLLLTQVLASTHSSLVMLGEVGGDAGLNLSTSIKTLAGFEFLFKCFQTEGEVHFRGSKIAQKVNIYGIYFLRL